jgi:hypothetical protein
LIQLFWRDDGGVEPSACGKTDSDANCCIDQESREIDTIDRQRLAGIARIWQLGETLPVARRQNDLVMKC